MIFLTVLSITILLLIAGGIIAFRYTKRVVVHEDHVAITINKNGFIKRVLPAGQHVLHPFEQIDFAVPVNTKLVTGRAIAIATGDGVSIKIDWSGIYAVQPDLIIESRSQRLRNLPNAEKAISRNVDLLLRRFVGTHTINQLFDPVIREQVEQQLGQILAAKLKPLGIVFNGLNLQTIELPKEVTEAMNKAKAIKTLDSTLRRIDPTTREVVRGVYQLDEILHWDQYLPVPSRRTMARIKKRPQSFK
jgi:regulator of protease activity HflC (stomatin/prohibitin superfamily)